MTDKTLSKEEAISELYNLMHTMTEEGTIFTWKPEKVRAIIDRIDTTEVSGKAEGMTCFTCTHFDENICQQSGGECLKHELKGES